MPILSKLTKVDTVKGVSGRSPSTRQSTRPPHIQPAPESARLFVPQGQQRTSSAKESLFVRIISMSTNQRPPKFKGPGIRLELLHLANPTSVRFWEGPRAPKAE
jgi:hypothetical protein